MRFTKALVCCVVAFWSLMLISVICWAQSYTLIDLGTLGGRRVAHLPSKAQVYPTIRTGVPRPLRF